MIINPYLDLPSFAVSPVVWQPYVVLSQLFATIISRVVAMVTTNLDRLRFFLDAHVSTNYS